jgi:hypothetical protein
VTDVRARGIIDDGGASSSARRVRAKHERVRIDSAHEGSDEFLAGDAAGESGICGAPAPDQTEIYD